MARRLVVGGLVLLLLVASGLSRAALDRLAEEIPEELLYLPNGRHLKTLSLGHAPVMADMLFLWAIQYYSNYEREERTLYVEHVFSAVITELDPHYIDAYWIGAMILIVEAHEVEAGLRLLEKGAEKNPDQWILPYLAAWEAFHAQMYDRARGYFEQASRVPGAPGVVRRMHAGLILRAGRTGDALAMWLELAGDPNADALSLKIAHRKVRELRVQVDIEGLQHAVRRFRNDNRRNPTTLEELVMRSYIDRLPQDPDSADYAYDPRTGTVSSQAGRLLGDR